MPVVSGYEVPAGCTAAEAVRHRLLAALRTAGVMGLYKIYRTVLSYAILYYTILYYTILD